MKSYVKSEIKTNKQSLIFKVIYRIQTPDPVLSGHCLPRSGSGRFLIWQKDPDQVPVGSRIEYKILLVCDRISIKKQYSDPAELNLK